MKLTCALVILNYNGRLLLEKCLPSVVAAARFAGKCHEVVVLDNGSTDGSLEWVAQHHPDVTCVRASSNRFLVSYNEYLAQSRHSLVLLLNNDVILQEGCLPPLLRHFEDTNVFSVAPLILNREGEQVENGRCYLEFSRGRFFYRCVDQKPGLTAFASCSAGIYDREKLLSFGGFDELLMPMYGEEMDLTLSAYARGWTVRFEPLSVAHHLGGATINEVTKRKARRSHLVKNRHLSIIKHIHDKRLFASYIAWILLQLPLRIATLDSAYFQGTWQAFSHMREAMSCRKREQVESVITDTEMFRLLAGLKQGTHA